MKMSADRLWCLKQFREFGWSAGRGGWDGIKKWDAHKAALVRAGLLERDEFGLYRVTPAGRGVMEEMK